MICNRFKCAPSLRGVAEKKSMSGGQTRAYPYIMYKWTSNWLHVYKQQMPDKTDMESEYGTRNDNVQLLFSPGCEQPLRDNKKKTVTNVRPFEIGKTVYNQCEAI